MLKFKKGDIFKEEVEAIVNPVNCVGVMGRGLALEFKKRFPENFKMYKESCLIGDVIPGRMLVTFGGCVKPYIFIINFPTKRHWKDLSCLEDISLGLDRLRLGLINNEVKSIAIPALGCGLGSLKWWVVKELISSKLNNLDVNIVVFEPYV
jgi:O-acetyl-ADP-ribose deacetylase (regulator of RNase III)